MVKGNIPGFITMLLFASSLWWNVFFRQAPNDHRDVMNGSRDRLWSILLVAFTEHELNRSTFAAVYAWRIMVQEQLRSIWRCSIRIITQVLLPNTPQLLQSSLPLLLQPLPAKEIRAKYTKQHWVIVSNCGLNTLLQVSITMCDQQTNNNATTWKYNGMRISYSRGPRNTKQSS